MNPGLAYAIIPARLHSTRLPEKLLLRQTGKSVLQHTYEAACSAKSIHRVLIATDHERIADEVRGFGGQVIMTSPDCQSGTDRVAEVVRDHLPDAEIVVNVQGDEPELAGQTIDLVVSLLQQDSVTRVATVATPIRTVEQLYDPACVKVVTDHHGRALYFSRSMIPFVRQSATGPSLDQLLRRSDGPFLQHLGLYAFRRDFLLQLHQLAASPLEKLEGLEQLRFLQAGVGLQVGTVQESSIGIDTIEDYQRFVRRQAA